MTKLKATAKQDKAARLHEKKKLRKQIKRGK